MVGLIDLNGSYMDHRYTDDMYMQFVWTAHSPRMKKQPATWNKSGTCWWHRYTE